MKDIPIKSPKKLIEVALPLDAINIACAHEKMPGIGAHPRGLHLWWARRPLAAARAVLFAQLVNDPGFERGNGFQRGLKKEDAKTERTRLFKIIEDLVKWENTDNEEILEVARREIRRSWDETCSLNKNHPEAKQLFNPDKIPAFHDPFAGGGAIPLEAQRLGLESYASDLNPVAVLINKVMIEIPPRFTGQYPIGPVSDSSHQIKISREWPGITGLIEDVRRYGALIQKEAFNRIGHLYPKITLTKEFGGGEANVIAWLWARTVKSPNPAYAHAEVPLVSSFVLSNKEGKEVYVQPIVTGDKYQFEIKYAKPPASAQRGTKLSRGANFQCLFSGSLISDKYVKAESMEGRMNTRLMAVVAEGPRGRVYLPPSTEMETIANQSNPIWKPEQKMNRDTSNLVSGRGYGFFTWADLFTSRQLTALSTFSDLIRELGPKIKHDIMTASKSGNKIDCDNNVSDPLGYAKAIITILSFAVDRTADFSNSCTRWVPGNQKVMNLFGKQAIAMTWDFPEANIFADTVGGFKTIVRYICDCIQKLPSKGIGHAFQEDAAKNATSENKIISTDPPYYDNIGYADLSDFFYVWLRPTLKSFYPELFNTIAVPKDEELVALPHRHESKKNAEKFFLEGMTKTMNVLSKKGHPGFPVTIYYAFKQSETTDIGTGNIGWETFLEAIIKSGFAITATWPMRSEQEYRMIGIGTNALASSIILACRKRDSSSLTISRREFIRELKDELAEAVDAMIDGANGISPVAPVDLAQAVIGPGMGIFSKYTAVLEADGSTMSVHTALTLINRALTDGKDDFDSDTLFCLSWFDQHGWAAAEFGSADVLARARGTSIDRIQSSGVIDAVSGKVRILRPSEYDTDWDPAKDNSIPSWELLHRVSASLENGGIESAAKLLAKVDPVKASPAPIRKLSYQLYTLCERAGSADDARKYNNLVLAWDEITLQALSFNKLITQATLFN